MKKIVFICNSCQEEGLGHFIRCFNIASSLHKLNPYLEIYFDGKYCFFALSKIKNHNFNLLNIDSKDWIYKESSSTSDKELDGLNKHVSWLRELVENLQDEDRNPSEFFKILKIDLFQDEIFVFTPNGDVVQLNNGSTPIDFAFNVHTQVGMHCLGAKVNSKIDHQLYFLCIPNVVDYNQELKEFLVYKKLMHTIK